MVMALTLRGGRAGRRGDEVEVQPQLWRHNPGRVTQHHDHGLLRYSSALLARHRRNIYFNLKSNGQELRKWLWL